MFTTQQLLSFVAVAEELHFGRAAARLRMTQPPLSRQIQTLERDLGVELLRRDRRSVNLTPAGHTLLAEARTILASLSRAEARVKRVAAGLDGHLSIGFTATAALQVLGAILSDIGGVLPQVSVELTEDVTVNQIAALESGQLDLALTRTAPSDPDYFSRVIHRERLLAAVPSGLSDTVANIGQFADADMILYSPHGSKYFDDVVTAALRGVPIRSEQRVTQVHSMLALVASRGAMAIVPESARVLHVDGVTLRPILGLTDPVIELRAVWLATNPNPALSRALFEIDSLKPCSDTDAASQDAEPDLDVASDPDLRSTRVGSDDAPDPARRRHGTH